MEDNSLTLNSSSESDIGSHFGMLLDNMEGLDVIFNVVREKFDAQIGIGCPIPCIRSLYFCQEGDEHDIEVTVMEPTAFKKCVAVDRELSIWIPGNKIPSWFNEQGECAIALKLPSQWNKSIMGFMVCVVFEGKWRTTYGNNSIIYKSEDNGTISIFYIPISVFGGRCIMHLMLLSGMVCLFSMKVVVCCGDKFIYMIQFRVGSIIYKFLWYHIFAFVKRNRVFIMLSLPNQVT